MCIPDTCGHINIHAGKNKENNKNQTGCMTAYKEVFEKAVQYTTNELFLPLRSLMREYSKTLLVWLRNANISDNKMDLWCDLFNVQILPWIMKHFDAFIKSLCLSEWPDMSIYDTTEMSSVWTMKGGKTSFVQFNWVLTVQKLPTSASFTAKLSYRGFSKAMMAETGWDEWQNEEITNLYFICKT